MARNTAIAHRITGTLGATYSGFPLTLAIFARSPDITTERYPLQLTKFTLADHNFSLGFRGDVGGDPINLYCGSNPPNTSRVVLSSNGYAANQWSLLIARFTSATDYDVFLNQTRTDGSTSLTPPTDPDFVIIGGYGASSTYSLFLNGDVAQAAIWSAAISDEELAAISKGFSPRRIRPQSLVFYAPLVRGLQDMSKSGVALSDTGTTVADHPRSYGF